MKQISSDQIVDNGIPNNAIKSLPRDLGDLKTSSSSKSGLGLINLGESGSPDIKDGLTSVVPPSPLPDTPSLIAIKSQTIKIKEDGTYAVDIVIEVEDIKNVSEYEVRIAKGAGSL